RESHLVLHDVVAVEFRGRRSVGRAGAGDIAFAVAEVQMPAAGWVVVGESVRRAVENELVVWQGLWSACVHRHLAWTVRAKRADLRPDEPVRPDDACMVRV